MHHGALLRSIGEEVPRYVAKRGFGQASFHGVIQL
jgi:hypothetical protein